MHEGRSVEAAGPGLVTCGHPPQLERPGEVPVRRRHLQGRLQLARTPLTYTWIDDYDWLSKYPLRKRSDGGVEGLTESVPWVMAQGDDLGHMRIDNRKAVAAGLTFRPLLTTARDTIQWRESDAVPEALKKQPRYVITPEQERALLEAWKARTGKPPAGAVSELDEHARGGHSRDHRVE